MHRADEVQFVVEHAEHRVVLEIDALHIGPHCEIVHAGFYDKRSKQLRAASSVVSISGLSCAADTKPVS